MSYKQQFLRGVRLESSSNKVQSCLDRLHSKYAAKAQTKTQQKSALSKQPQLSLAGFRLPSYLEDLGIFCVGSPGSGKSQAIAKLIQELQQRDDYRIVCLDRTLDSPKGYPKGFDSCSWGEPPRPHCLTAPHIASTRGTRAARCLAMGSSPLAFIVREKTCCLIPLTSVLWVGAIVVSLPRWKPSHLGLFP